MDNSEIIGESHWLQNELDAEKVEIHSLARVISVHKGRYLISNGKTEVFAELLGNFYYAAESAVDLPTTGDWVYADFYDDDTHAIIHSIVPRKSLLKRKMAGKLVDYQLIAANIDVAFIIQSVNENFNLRRLERYLVMVNDAEITPIVLLSKCDLILQEEIDETTERVRSVAPNIEVIDFSNVSGKNVDAIQNSLQTGHTYCLLGSSGVGKTTLLNSLLGGSQFHTQSVSSKQSKGRHTTTTRELVLLDSGALVIDTPGMRELGNISVDAGIEETFSEIVELAQNCQFGNCTHVRETGCAIRVALADGVLSDQRYSSYIKMKKEAAFNDMSYSEKRKKDKDLGKLIKATMKLKQR